ncbi:MAG: hypothetical protein H5T83_04665 [Actinotalea sp.]|nr:hypothetical protein [Actinotalea sp.]
MRGTGRRIAGPREAARLALAGALLAAALAGCATGADDAPTAPPAGPSSPTPEPTEATMTPSPAPGATPGDVGTTAEDAVADLAARRGVDPSAVTVVGDDEVTWRDASLGCPAPGMAYAQVLTPGRLVVLEVEGTTVEYHSGGQRGLFLCDAPEPPLDTATDR